VTQVIKKSKRFDSAARLIRVVGLISIVLISFIVVQKHQTYNPHFDVFDEGAHFDYVYKLKSGQVPSWDSTYGQTTMLIADCLGSIFAKGQNCEEKVRAPENFPPKGFSYQAQQPPLGYLQYVLVPSTSNSSPLEKLNKTRDFGLIVILGLYFLIFALLYRLFELKFFGLHAFALLILLNPIQIHALSTISNDAASGLAALLIILVVSHIFRQVKVSKLSLAAVGITIGLVKGLLLVLPFSFLILAIVLKRIPSNRQQASPNKSLFLFNLRNYMLLIFQFGLLSNLSFLLYQGIRSQTSSQQVFDALLGFSEPVSIFQLDTLLQSFVNMFSSFSGNWFGKAYESNLFALLGLILTSILGFAIFRQESLGGLDGRKPKSTTLEHDYAFLAKLFGYSYLIASAAIAIAWPIIWYLNGNYDFPAPQRYNLVTLPLLAASIVLAIKSKFDPNGRPQIKS
jgi:hypothetical protein